MEPHWTPVTLQASTFTIHPTLDFSKACRPEVGPVRNTSALWLFLTVFVQMPKQAQVKGWEAGSQGGFQD